MLYKWTLAYFLAFEQVKIDSSSLYSECTVHPAWTLGPENSAEVTGKDELGFPPPWAAASWAHTCFPDTLREQRS